MSIEDKVTVLHRKKSKFGELRAVKAIKIHTVGKEVIRNNFNGFINWNVGKQRNNVKAGYEFVICIDVTANVQKLLNKREGIFHDEGVHGQRVRKGMKNLAILYE